jgi:hypothetical protein
LNLASKFQNGLPTAVIAGMKPNCMTLGRKIFSVFAANVIVAITSRWTGKMHWKGKI